MPIIGRFNKYFHCSHKKANNREQGWVFDTVSYKSKWENENWVKENIRMNVEDSKLKKEKGYAFEFIEMDEDGDYICKLYYVK